MTDNKIKSLMETFGMAVPVSEWRAYGHGHINDTYLIRTPGAIPDFILQRKNHLIFKDISGMMNNIVLVTNHIRKKLMAAGEAEIDRKVMTYIPTMDNQYFTRDEEGNYWTLFLFVRGSHGIEEVSQPDQAFSAGTAFGHFQKQLSDFPGHLLVDTIPGFHNGKGRLAQFKTAIAENKAGRVEAMQPVIDRLLSRAGEMTQLQEWIDSGAIPLRVTHNDTKINNVLYDDQGQILCIIDLDTVMPGTALFDFGDAIRTLGNTAAEDEADLQKIGFNSVYFQSFTEGYLSESREFLTGKEILNLPFSCRYLVWEQSIRFLADYLNGDTYYKIAYPEHNKVRTLAQLRYLEVLEENLPFMQSVVTRN